MRIILLLLSEPLLGRGIAAAARLERCRAEKAQSWVGLLQRCSASPEPDLIVFDPLAAEASVSELAEFRSLHPEIGCLVYSSFTGFPAKHLLELGNGGMSHALTFDQDDQPGAFTATLDEALSSSAHGRILTHLTRRVPQEMREIVEFIWKHAADPDLIHVVARNVRCHPKTLRERFARAGLPPPGRLAMWCRVLQAAVLIQERRPVASVAYVVGYRSPAVLYRHLRCLGGIGPADVRVQGGLDRVLSALAREIGTRRCAG